MQLLLLRFLEFVLLSPITHSYQVFFFKKCVCVNKTQTFKHLFENSEALNQEGGGVFIIIKFILIIKEGPIKENS